MKLHQWRHAFRRKLAKAYSTTETDWLFFLFLEHLENISKEKFFMLPEEEARSPQWDHVLNRLEAGEPWQYIAGRTEWAGLEILVTPDVLIPRPETEEMVYRIRTEWQSTPPLRILDVGTGSGAIALAMKTFFPVARVWGMDYRKEVLDVARNNALHNKRDVRFVLRDVMNEGFPQGPWDMVVSNPPYVLPLEEKQMETHVLDYEPHDALFVPEDDPLIFYKKIMDEFLLHGAENGKLFLEINPLTRELLEQEARQRDLTAQFFRDMQGKWRFAQMSK